MSTCSIFHSCFDHNARGEFCLPVVTTQEFYLRFFSATV
jgi:hypothetical protein